jgi:hypothetical protein
MGLCFFFNYALHLDAGTTSVFSLWCSGVGRKGNTRDASIYCEQHGAQGQPAIAGGGGPQRARHVDVGSGHA